MDIQKELSRIAADLNPLDGKSNPQARKIVGDIMRKAITQHFYTDEYWKGPNDVMKALSENKIDWDLDGTKYGPEMAYKEWKISVTFKNNNGRETVMHGTITASGAGTVEDKLSRYDLVTQIY